MLYVFLKRIFLTKILFNTVEKFNKKKFSNNLSCIILKAMGKDNLIVADKGRGRRNAAIYIGGHQCIVNCGRKLLCK